MTWGEIAWWTVSGFAVLYPVALLAYVFFGEPRGRR